MTLVRRTALTPASGPAGTEAVLQGMRFVFREVPSARSSSPVGAELCVLDVFGSLHRCVQPGL
jgi:hypothetical protein